MKKSFLIPLIILISIGCTKEDKSNANQKNKTSLEKLIDGNQRFLNEKTIPLPAYLALSYP